MDLHTTLITVIAFAAVISVLSVIFSWLLMPLKENQVRLEARLEAGLKESQVRLEAGLKESQVRMNRLEENQVHLAEGLKELSFELRGLRNDLNGRGQIKPQPS